MSLTFVDRAQAYREAARHVHALEIADRPEADRLDDITASLVELATRSDLFPPEAFPRSPGSSGGLFRLAQAPDGRGGLYVSLGYTGRGGGSPHTHASWAVVAGVSGGIETNRIYQRLDDATAAGDPQLEFVEEVAVGPGDAVVLPTGAYHTIEVISETPVLHVHAYGHRAERPGFQPPLPVVDFDEAEREAAAGRAVLLALDETGEMPASPHVVISSLERAADVLAGIDRQLPVIVIGPTDAQDAAATKLYGDERWVVFAVQAPRTEAFSDARGG